MKKVITILMTLSLALVSGCGSSEPTTTTTTITTTEATTESPYTNESDRTIASLATDNHPTFSWLNSLEFWESEKGVIISVDAKYGDEYIKACKFLISQVKSADYFKDAAIVVVYDNGTDHFESYFTASDNYEKAMLTSKNLDEPIFDLTIEDLEDAFKEASNKKDGD